MRKKKAGRKVFGWVRNLGRTFLFWVKYRGVGMGETE
jgi:hypothetical protein